ncbi:hypothetical protein HYPSUDRAFT_202609 [Hypholoma sublateritium FD-334 SS-4]|uniref:Uncharacterized protein n=1 Tax=Hypholoma sublateritium (strain FD-334 SS-4) TaxID=945553 RepID=A0A0D2MEB1_HYPSF|nr:hypothetical protein HYPSUDRAFT_202609 [Hypholoma sublateritium FD-334 SS-4]
MFVVSTQAFPGIRSSILAADCCLALLASDRLTKQEELITACLNTIKNQLTKILYPFVEASAEGGATHSISPLLVGIVKNAHSMTSAHRGQLGELLVALSAVIPRINNLVNAEAVAMSDSIIIQAVYIAIGPFFVVDLSGETDAKGKKESVVIRTLGCGSTRCRSSKFTVPSLDDIKMNSQTDSNAAKTMSLDHLGVIAARIRTKSNVD